MKSTRRILALTLCLVMCLALFPAQASAAGIVSSGWANTAETAEFVLYSDGRMVVSGTGAIDPMNQWTFSNVPTYQTKDEAIKQTRSGIMSLTIEEGIVSIGSQAFWDCPKLTAVGLPVSLITISSEAFASCASLRDIAIPSNVKWINSQAFANCSSLSKVYLSDGLQLIDDQAFLNCASLSEITIPANVMFIGSEAFRGCGLNTIYFTGDNVGTGMIAGDAFANIKAVAYYPADNETWNNGVVLYGTDPFQDYGGRLEWKASTAVTASDGWVRKGTDADGNTIWYYYMNGVMVRSNWVAYQGFWFYFDANGRMLRGRQLINGKYYFLDRNTGARQSGLREGEFYDDNGVWQPGYSEIDDTALNMFQNGWQQVNGKWYYIMNKAKVKGWVQDGQGFWYYLDPATGAMVTGWLTVDGNTYYLRTRDMAIQDGLNARKEGSMVASCSKTIGGTVYTFGDNGALLGGRTDQSPMAVNPLTGNPVDATGFQQDLDANGNPGGAWYFLRSDGTYATGWELVNNNWYFFGTDYKLITGWVQSGLDWYYLDPNSNPIGQMVTGPKTIKGTTYVFQTNGAMAREAWVLSNNKWYYANFDGVAVIGWMQWWGNGKWYYMDDGTTNRPDGSGKFNRGEMVIGVVDIPATVDGRPNEWKGKHSFNNDGIWVGEGDKLSGNTGGGKWSGDCYLDINGVALKGWQQVGGEWYYLNPANGNKKIKSDWFQDPNSGKWYYFDKDGKMVKGEQVIDGKPYLFDWFNGDYYGPLA